MEQEVRIPDIGDVEEVEVIEICVAVGDQVGPDDALIVIESDKASMEVPAGLNGRVASISVALGDMVAEGTPILTVTSDEGAQAAADADVQPSEGSAAPETEAAPVEAAPEKEAEAGGRSAPEASRTESSTGAPIEVRVPDIGEATGVVVIEVAVSAGDRVGADDLLVVVESDKASMEIPAGSAGTIEAVQVSEGDEVEEGTLLAVILSEDGASAASGAQPAESPPAGGDQPQSSPQEAATSTAGDAATEPEPVAGPAEQPRKDVETVSADERSSEIYAGPAVRRLARELGVQLAEVKGTGNRGRIVKDDVKAHVKNRMTEKVSSPGGAIPQIPAVDFSRFGPVEKVPLSRIRAAGARNLHRSWLNLPHVAQFEEADVTELEAFRRTLKEEATRRGVKITPLSFIVKACCHALKAHPTFNASLDQEAKHFFLKAYYHVGFAVDTDEGLVVPVIRDADKLGVWELSEVIAELAEKARTGTLGMSDLAGGTFSVSSLGGIGGTGFTPIINAPEVAILGVSRLVTKPIWNGSEFIPRQMLPLSLSYDHRAINGAEAGRFMMLLAELLADIRRLAL